MTKTITVFGQEVEVGNDPIPPQRRSNPDVDGLKDLPVGGNVTIPCHDDDAANLRNRVSNAGKRFGMKFSTRTLNEGVGVWRVE